MAYRSICAVTFFLLGSALMVFGAVARLGALLTVFGFAVEVTAHGLGASTSVALAATLGVMLLGSGSFSAWQPEEEVLRRHAGARTW